jgi:hypothetical protein
MDGAAMAYFQNIVAAVTPRNRGNVIIIPARERVVTE